MRKGQAAPRSFSDHVEPSQHHRPPAPDAPPAEQRGRLRRLHAAAQARRRRARAAGQRPPAHRARGPPARRRGRERRRVLPDPAPDARRAAHRGWVTVPPSAASGGHTTMFRMVDALEQAGHTCVVYLDDRHGWDIEQHRATSGTLAARHPRRGPRRRAPASRTPTRSSPPAGRPPTRCSPPRPGARAATASRTSSRPSTRPAATPCSPRPPTASASTASPHGGWLAQMLRRDYGMQADHFDFGCDLETYASTARPEPRSGGPASATTAAPRRRAAPTSSRSPRSTCSPPATPRSTSTSTASRPAGCPSARSTTAS